MKIKLSTILKAALLVAISVVLSRFLAIMVPLGSFPTLRIGFGMIPIMLSGILLGPAVGFISGILADLIGYMINPQGGAMIIGLTLTSGLYGFFGGLFYHTLKIQDKKINFNIINVVIIASLTLFILANNPIGEQLELHQILIAILMLIVAIIYSVLPLILDFIVKRGEKNRDNRGFDKIAFVVSFTHLICSTILNTYFLSQAFGSSFLQFVPGRVLSGIAMIPLYSFVLFAILRVVKIPQANQ